VINLSSTNCDERQKRGMSIQLAACFLILITFLCSYIPSAAQNSIARIDIQPAAGLPEEFVSDVDVLFVYDNALLNQLPFTQFDWVSSKEEYLDRADDLLELLQFHIAADSESQMVPLPQRYSQAVAVLVFASHEDPVAEAIDITFETGILLQIESYGINVIQN